MDFQSKRVKICANCGTEFTIRGTLKAYQYKNKTKYYCSYKCMREDGGDNKKYYK